MRSCERDQDRRIRSALALAEFLGMPIERELDAQQCQATVGAILLAKALEDLALIADAHTEK